MMRVLFLVDQHLNELIGKHEAQIEIRNQALTLLKDYVFEHDAPIQTYTVATTATTGMWR